MPFATSPGEIFSTLICQNQTSSRHKLSVAYVCRTAQSAASTRAKVGAKWKDFGKLLVKKARQKAGEMSIARALLNYAEISFSYTL